MQGLKRLVSVVAVFAVVALPSQAFAQEASQSAYSQGDSAVIEDPGAGVASASDAAGDTSESGGGALPFTGLDALLLLAAGGALVATGLGMRRLTRAPESA